MSASVRRREFVLSLLFGLSTIGWSIMGLYDSSPAARTTVVRIAVSILNACVGILFIVRSSNVRYGHWKSVLMCVPSLVVCGTSFKLAAPFESWPQFAELIFVGGTFLAVVSFLFLGRSFAVLPSVRTVVVNGPYRIVRHPAYLGEFLMILACCISDFRIVVLVPLLLALPFIMIRIQAEEKLLSSDDNYAEYRRRVKWRLIPGLW